MRTPENITVVTESVLEVPSTSIHRPSEQLHISETSWRRIFHKNLGMTPYKVQFIQGLKPIDHTMCFRFPKWACDQLTEDADFSTQKIMFSDEAHFALGVCVNKQNCRIWGTENPLAHIEKPTHPKRVTVFCGLWVQSVIFLRK